MNERSGNGYKQPDIIGELVRWRSHGERLRASTPTRRYQAGLVRAQLNSLHEIIKDGNALETELPFELALLNHYLNTRKRERPGFPLNPHRKPYDQETVTGARKIIRENLIPKTESAPGQQ